MSARADLDREAWALLTELAEQLDHDRARALVARHRTLNAAGVAGLLERWRALRPAIDGTPAHMEIAHSDLVEALQVARGLDQAAEAADDVPGDVQEARAWFYANSLPTTYRPVSSA